MKVRIVHGTARVVAWASPCRLRIGASQGWRIPGPLRASSAASLSFLDNAARQQLRNACEMAGMRE